MSKIRNWFVSNQFKTKVKPEIVRIAAVVVFTFIYGIGVSWFLEASVYPMYTGGIPGLAQLVRDFLVFVLNVDMVSWQGAFLGMFIIVANIPILLLGWFGVSKKFTIYSLVSILIQATILGYIPALPLGLEHPEHAVTISILGGVLIGIGAGGALKYGTSTGGLDIVAQYISLRNGKSVGMISMTMNIMTAILGGLITHGHVVSGVEIIGGVVASYTILRLIISTIVTDRIHTAYQFISVEIISDNPNQIISDILSKIYRGVTLMRVEGGYTHKEKTLVMVIIAAYELTTLTQMVQQVDPKAFMITKPVKQVFGNFKRKTIA